jgi:hypothetical protein
MIDTIIKRTFTGEKWVKLTSSVHALGQNYKDACKNYLIAPLKLWCLYPSPPCSTFRPKPWPGRTKIISAEGPQTVEPTFFAHFYPPTGPSTNKNLFRPAHHRRCLKKRVKMVCSALIRLSPHILYSTWGWGGGWAVYTIWLI